MDQDCLVRLSPGRFRFPEIYGEDWRRLSMGARVRAGRHFMELVRKGRFPNVEDSGEKAGGGRIYLKRG